MILDKIENIDLYSGISENIKNAIEYLKQTDFSKKEIGKHEVDDNMFYIVNEYETQDFNGILEAHKTYIDLQYILEGSEIIQFESLEKQKIKKAYNSKDDYAFYFSNNPTQLILEEGNFAIFFPNDLHVPGIKNRETKNIRKVVFKIINC